MPQQIKFRPMHQGVIHANFLQSSQDLQSSEELSQSGSCISHSWSFIDSEELNSPKHSVDMSDMQDQVQFPEEESKQEEESKDKEEAKRPSANQLYSNSLD